MPRLESTSAAPLFDERRQTLHLSVPKTGLKVDADVGRMVQVIANLLTNAAKYSGPETTVWVKAEQDRNCVHLSVEDEGCGIEPEMLKRIFHLFTQQKHVGRS